MEAITHKKGGGVTRCVVASLIVVGVLLWVYNLFLMPDRPPVIASSMRSFITTVTLSDSEATSHPTVEIVATPSQCTGDGANVLTWQQSMGTATRSLASDCQWTITASHVAGAEFDGGCDVFWWYQNGTLPVSFEGEDRSFRVDINHPNGWEYANSNMLIDRAVFVVQTPETGTSCAKVPVVVLSTSPAEVTEGDSNVRVTVTGKIPDSMVNSESVQYMTLSYKNGSADSSDYSTSNYGEFSLVYYAREVTSAAVGSSRFTISVTDDSEVEGTENFYITVPTTANSGFIVEDAEIRILDNDRSSAASTTTTTTLPPTEEPDCVSTPWLCVKTDSTVTSTPTSTTTSTTTSTPTSLVLPREVNPTSTTTSTSTTTTIVPDVLSPEAPVPSASTTTIPPSPSPSSTTTTTTTSTTTTIVSDVLSPEAPVPSASTTTIPASPPPSSFTPESPSTTTSTTTTMPTSQSEDPITETPSEEDSETDNNPDNPDILNPNYPTSTTIPDKTNTPEAPGEETAPPTSPTPTTPITIMLYPEAETPSYPPATFPSNQPSIPSQGPKKDRTMG